jgi:hypothetical protein
MNLYIYYIYVIFINYILICKIWLIINININSYDYRIKQDGKKDIFELL